MKAKEKYTKIPDKILSSTELTPSQKLIISYVLRWQSSGKICFESNKTLSIRFGVSISAIKKQITQLNKLPFFISEESSDFNEFGKWSNSKRMMVDPKKLDQFLKVATPAETLKEQTDFKDERIDSFQQYSNYVQEYTKGTATEKSIQYYYDFLKNGEVPITKGAVQTLFRRRK